MEPTSPEPGVTSREELARMIDHLLLRPELSDEEVIAGCRLAARCGVASVVVRPPDVELAVSVLGSTGVAVAGVAGFPYGWDTTPAKLYQARDLLRRGAREIEAAVNIGKLRSRQFQYVEMELLQLAEVCHEREARLKVVIDAAHLGKDLQIVACKLAKRSRADFIALCEGEAPAAEEVLRLAAAQCIPRTQLKAGGDAATLAQVLGAKAAGCARVGTTRTEEILEAWQRQSVPEEDSST